MDRDETDENNKQHSQSQDIESDGTHTNREDIESDETSTNQEDIEAIPTRTPTREFLSIINATPEEDISVAFERLTLGHPRTDWSGLCWDPELVQENEHSDTPPHAADQSATQRPAASSTQAGKSLEGANPAEDKGKANPRVKGVIEEADKRAEEAEEEYFAKIQSHRHN